VNRLSETTWHGQPAWALESNALRVVTVPGMGAKIVSIVHKEAGHEWLLGSADRPFRPADYGASFVAQDMSGWDEMFPTIEACPYPGDGPFAGNALPDHGEVWALPWQIAETRGGALTLQVSGRALPYDLIRTLSLADAHTLRMDYAVTNTGGAPLAGMWTAHPQFAVTAATEVRLPQEVTQVLAVTPLPDAAAGAHVDWPVMPVRDGEPLYLDRVGPAANCRSRKVYLLPDQHIAWAMLLDTASKRWLRLEWDAALVPYLGIWEDEGQYNPTPTIALEPSTGYYDSLARAWANEQAPILAPGETLKWSLYVRVGMEQ
jgi:galactose mutarotase-like enzyme